MKKTCIIILSVFLTHVGVAQDFGSKEKDEKAYSVPFFVGSIGWTFPGGEMGNRYNSFLSTGAGIGWKSLSNWVMIGEFGFQFGSENVKIKNQILGNLLAPDGAQGMIISKEGLDAGVVASNRNFSGSIRVGKIFPLFLNQPNSGLWVSISGGMIQHQIFYLCSIGEAPQIQGDYARGYDRQMRGFMTGACLGYWYMGKKTYANFYIGLEMNNAWTRSSRNYQFDLKRGDSKTYLDQMYTLKLGWIIPFHGKQGNKVYFF